ncbi:Inositol oxygenase [Portunus trituberculatus]|uniref:Inositol oxygenase n=1 Tax=Portunus trituberculatus TaxID=210409 RepID=A0A5B7CPI5_PORTR|nr:Inositol oxygenase [Portunus trituberculatus]
MILELHLLLLAGMGPINHLPHNALLGAALRLPGPRHTPTPHPCHIAATSDHSHGRKCSSSSSSFSSSSSSSSTQQKRCLLLLPNHKEWGQFNKFEATIMEALEKLNNLVDESDPDVTVPNIVHAFQTAERLREAHPDKDWLHLTGLIHDLGKVMAFYGEPQWSTVGDTFLVGCEFAQSIVYRDSTFHNNPDLNNPKFNTKYGMYEPNCGLDKVYVSWGHDEYLYQVLKHNKSTLPEEGLYMISKFDLYTKKEKVPDMDQLRPYYQSLIDKYCPGKLKW